VPLRLPKLRLPALRRRQDPRSADGTMPLMAHLFELRRRLFFAVLGILGGTVLGFIWFGQGIPAIGLPKLSEILTGPYCAVPSAQRVTFGADAECKLLATGPFSAVELQLKSALIAGSVLSSPVWLHQLWAYVTPALYSKERRYAVTFVGFGGLLFAIGAVLAYVVIREGLTVLLGFGGDDVRPRNRRAGLRHQRLAFEDGARVDHVRLAEALQERRHRLRAALAEQSDQGRAFGQGARGGQRVLAHSPQVLAGDGAGELHARLALLVGEVTEHRDSEPGDAGNDEHDRAEIDGGKGPRQTHLAGVIAKPRDELAEALQHGLNGPCSLAVRRGSSRSG